MSYNKGNQDEKRKLSTKDDLKKRLSENNFSETSSFTKKN